MTFLSAIMTSAFSYISPRIVHRIPLGKTMVFFLNNPEMDYFTTFMDNLGLFTKTSALLILELKCYIKMIYVK